MPLPILSILEARLATLETTELRDFLMTVLSWMDEPPLISGEDVVSLGIPEGRQVGLLLNRVRRLQLDGMIGSREKAVAYLRGLKG